MDNTAPRAPVAEEDRAMPLHEKLYLALVVFSFVSFMASLAAVTAVENSKHGFRA